MLNFSKLRIFLVIFFCIFAITFALPSFLSKDGKLAEILPDNRINLGLDLRGGSQLTLQVDFKHYLKEQLTNLERGIKSAFRENAIRALPIIGRDRISFYFKDQSRHDEIKDLIKEINNKVEISEDDGNFEISFPDQKSPKCAVRLSPSQSKLFAAELMKMARKNQPSKPRVKIGFYYKFQELKIRAN